MPKNSTTDWKSFDLFNQVPTGIAIIDRNYRIAGANQTFVDTFGPWEGKKCFEVYKKRKRVCKNCAAFQTFVDGRTRVSEEQGQDSRGKTQYYLVHIAPYRSDNGDITHILEMSTDITEKVALQNKYQTLFENVPCYITVIDREFKVIQANQAFLKTFGKDLGSHCFESYKKRSAVCEECPARRVFKDGRPHHSLQEGFDWKGNKIYYMVTATPFQNEGNMVRSVMEIALDVTKVSLLEKRLHETEFQEEIVKNAIGGIVASDKDGVVRIYNPAAQSIFKHPKNRIIGKKPGEELYPKDFLMALDDEGGTVVLKESKIRDAKGVEVPVIVSGRRLQDATRGIETVMFLQDLSKVKQLEHEILEAERLAAVGQTVAGLSHGIKNILMGLEGGMYVVNSGIRREDHNLVRQGWEMLQSNIEKVSSFVREFLSFAKGTVPRVELADPHEIAVEVVNLYLEAAQQSGIVFETSLEEHIAEAPMDSRGVHTCLANLISNAIDACLMSNAKRPTIHFSLYEKKGSICFEVKDNGCGMDCEVKKKIFTNFFTTKGSGHGTGLGLLTTRKIVQEHGGKITFDSALGRGSVFRLEFPRSRLPLLDRKEDKSNSARRNQDG